jgi:hypothetical protein
MAEEKLAIQNSGSQIPQIFKNNFCIMQNDNAAFRKICDSCLDSSKK